jgi:uncharacterized protein YqjF (DUF2071 family)
MTAILRSALALDLTSAALIGVVVAPIGFGLLYAFLRLRRERRAQAVIERLFWSDRCD